MASDKTFPWHDRVINHAQLGGIETSVLDNGPGRSNRIAWINTGSGLRYKVVIDRALDIADAFYNEHSLCYITHAGVTAPQGDANRNLEWLTYFGAGLLTTCGLTHTGGPEDGRGVHGKISNLRATLESVIQPDPLNGKLDMSITAVTKQTSMFGPNLELRRTISSTLGKPEINIHDVITNLSNTPAPHMYLYHCNFGWPLIDAGTDLVWQGKWQHAGKDMDKQYFKVESRKRKCSKPLDSHAGAVEGLAFIQPKADKKGFCNVGICNRKLQLGIKMKYKKKQLPWLMNWNHYGPREYVCGFEPGTYPPMGQNEAKKAKKLIYIPPGKSRIYDLQITVLNEKKQIDQFLKASGY